MLHIPFFFAILYQGFATLRSLVVKVIFLVAMGVNCGENGFSSSSLSLS